MNARNWTIKTASALIGILLTLIITVNFVIDPYGEFHFFEGSYNKLKLKAEKTSALNVAAKLEHDKYALVFGSSRTMLIDKEILGKPVLNFSTSIYNNPGDILALLKMFDEKQLKNITEIYYLIDINSFHYASAAPEMASKGSLLLETVRNVGPQKIEDAWECIKTNLAGYSETDYPNNVDEFGTLHKVEKGFNEKIPFFDSHTITPYYLHSLAEVAAYCKVNSIKIKFFTLPWQRAFPGNQQDKIEDYFPQIVQACRKYYNFQLNTPLTGNKLYFADPSHLNVEGLRTFFGQQKWDSPLLADNTAAAAQLDFSTISPAAFMQYIEKDYDVGSQIQLSNKLMAAGREDLILTLLKTPTAKTNSRTLIADGFLFSDKNLLKTALKHYPQLFNRPDILDVSLTQAIASGNIENIRDAILMGADLNRVDELGRTPLISAALYSPSVEIISTLIKSGANPMYISKDKDHLAYYNRSIFTIAFDSDKRELLDYLDLEFADSPLLKHIKLLEKIEKEPQNMAAYTECRTLQEKHYKSDNLMTARLFYLHPKEHYIKDINGATVLQLNQSKYKVQPLTKALLENISIRSRVDDIIRQSFMTITQKRITAAPEDQRIVNTISKSLDRLVPLLLRNKAAMILK